MERRLGRGLSHLVAALALASVLACEPSGEMSAGGEWSGTVDTLPSGQVVVENPETPLWPEGRAWRVVEELRIGGVEGDGPEVFGRIRGLEVDERGRIWVLDGQAQELRVFDASGEHVRTVGRQGGGPGEFARAVRVDRGPQGRMWVADPENNRISMFDSAGAFLESKPMGTGFVLVPWPGGFDVEGSYYGPVARPVDGEFRTALVRYDTTLTPLDTLPTLRDPVSRERFERRLDGGGRIATGVPFQGALVRRLSPRGTIWGLVTDRYRLVELNAAGDTLRTITRDFTPEPVTAADRERARERLEWFTEQGGQIDLTRLPETKAPVSTFFVDRDGFVWVRHADDADPGPSAGSDGADPSAGGTHDLFDPTGRFLGPVRLPFVSEGGARLLRRGDHLYGVAEDELGVRSVVRVRIVRP